MSTEDFQEPAKKSATTSPVRIVLTGSRSAFIGPNLILEPYRTAVATILVGLDYDVSVSLIEEVEQRAKSHPIMVIPPDTLCEVSADGDIALIFCDAIADVYSEIDLRGLGAQIEPLRQLLKAGPSNTLPEVFLRNVCGRLGMETEQTARTEIQRVVHALGRSPEAFPSVEQAASLAGLSPMRFQHVFTETVGMPFRRYRQWRRMGRVIRELAEGESLTSAAYGAGFSNSAHLSTAFKAMFGLSPSALIAHNAEFFLSDAEFGEVPPERYRQS